VAAKVALGLEAEPLQQPLRALVAGVGAGPEALQPAGLAFKIDGYTVRLTPAR